MYYLHEPPKSLWVFNEQYAAGFPVGKLFIDQIMVAKAYIKPQFRNGRVVLTRQSLDVK